MNINKIISFCILFLLSIAANAQIYQNDPAYGKVNNRIDVIYSLKIPNQDTFALQGSRDSIGQIVRRPQDGALYLRGVSSWSKVGQAPGGSVLDSARKSNDTLFFRKSTGGEIALKLNNIPQSGIIGLTDSLNKRWDTLQFPIKVQYTIMDKLLSESAIPIQPTDSVVVAMGKLQAQINAQDGLNIKNQKLTYQIADFRIMGSGDIQATSAAGGLNLRRGSAMNYYPIVNFMTNAGTNTGYVGGGSNVDGFRIDLISLFGGTRLISADTNSVRFGNYSVASNSRVSTGYHNLKWLMMPSFPVDNDHFFDVDSNYKKTLTVYGGILTDTAFINGIYLQGGSAGQYLTLDATGKLVTPTTLPSFAPATGSTNYIQNQSASAQSSSSFWVSGSSRTNGVHSMGSASRITGTGTGASNVALFSFRQSDNSTETGSVGDVSSGNSDIALSSTSGDVVFVTSGVKARVSGTNTTFGVAGSFGAATATVTGTTTLTAAHYTLRCNNSANIVVNLPAAASAFNSSEGHGRIYVIKKVSNNAFTVTITANGAEQIDGISTTSVITTFNTSITIQSNGTGWDIL